MNAGSFAWSVYSQSSISDYGHSKLFNFSKVFQIIKLVSRLPCSYSPFSFCPLSPPLFCQTSQRAVQMFCFCFLTSDYTSPHSIRHSMSSLYQNSPLSLMSKMVSTSVHIPIDVWPHLDIQQCLRC